MDKYQLSAIGVICLTALQSIALFQHIDGALFLPIVAAITGVIAGAVGYKHGDTTGYKRCSVEFINKQKNTK
jgi:tetrahydromethanopterin S-methyltransferase subunit E